jgi:hypothetical protein
VCVAKTYRHTQTHRVNNTKGGGFGWQGTRQEPRKRIDLDLSRHFMVNFVSTADETRIIRKTRTATVVASLPLSSYIATLLLFNLAELFLMFQSKEEEKKQFSVSDFL